MASLSSISAAVLIADPDPTTRAATGAALEEAGWRVQVASDLVGCRAVLAKGVGLALVSSKMAEGDLLSLCQALKQAPGGMDCSFLLALDPEQGRVLDAAGLEVLLGAGVEDFIEGELCPALLCHRLRRLLPNEIGNAAHQGCWLGRERFMARLTDRLAARDGETKVAVITAVLEDTRRAGFWTTISPAGEQALAESLTQRMSTAFDAQDQDEGEIGSLQPLLAGMHLTMIEPGVIAMMIPGVTRLQDTAKIGARIQEQFVEPMMIDGSLVALQVGLGVSACPEDGCDAGRLFSNALEAARRARREGSSLMVFHTEAMGRWAFERLTLERSLREAIEREELRVYYQPRVDAETRQIKGMEALVRWQHPDLGLVPPGQFIPLAEETGLIVPIGEWVLREACRQNKAWRDVGLPPISVSVNLSPVQFRKADLYDVVMEVLTATGLPEGGLELEVTESMLMNDPKQTIDTLQRLKGAGIHISIDDFGTGYSSLSYLKRFPIDALKIDRSFITDVTTNADDAAIATAIILMGHSLKLSVVAEGVETESQMEFLRVLQCNEIQGYLFSPPVPADQAQELLRQLGGSALAA
jgi:EAL domain-containing protein (putative c-di-GMP-specific phosphodiesterase class I)/CheY-like chemotaxis protein